MSRIVAVCLLASVVAIAINANAQPQHRFSVDDLLRLESVGAAKVDPTGHWLVYERAPRYDQLPDYSVGRIGTWNSTGGWLMIVDLTAAEPSPKLLFKPDPKKMYWIDSFSPDGQSLAFYAAETKRLSTFVSGAKGTRRRVRPISDTCGSKSSSGMRNILTKDHKQQAQPERKRQLQGRAQQTNDEIEKCGLLGTGKALTTKADDSCPRISSLAVQIPTPRGNL
ncbi:MAG: hypothetical protein ROO76_02760 [Terriglobia bacterium]|nr:hypothetical protein [Terriglobia bacterium]